MPRKKKERPKIKTVWVKDLMAESKGWPPKNVPFLAWIVTGGFSEYIQEAKIIGISPSTDPKSGTHCYQSETGSWWPAKDLFPSVTEAFVALKERRDAMNDRIAVGQESHNRMIKDMESVRKYADGRVEEVRGVLRKVWHSRMKMALALIASGSNPNMAPAFIAKEALTYGDRVSKEEDPWQEPTAPANE